MPPRCEEKGLIAGAVLVAITAESPAAGASTIDDGELRVAGCTASRMRVELGETVTLNASASDAGFIKFDGDGDGNYKCGDERDFISNATFQEAGTYGPVTRTDGKDTDSWGTPNKPPSLLLTATPNPAATGEQVSFDASGSTDVGLESSVVEFTASSADRAAGERTVAAAFRAFVWSNGVAMTDPDRTVNHCALHNSVGCSRVPGNNPIETPATEESFDRSRHRESRWQGTGLGKRAVRVAGYRCDSHRNRQGRTLGRDELQATGVDRTGFKIETESVGLERYQTDNRRSVVFYTAWREEENY